MSIVVYSQDCSMRSFKKTTRHVCVFYFSSVKYQFYIHFQNKYQLWGFVHYTSYWDFAPGPHWVTSVPQDIIPFASIHGPLQLPSR